MPDGWPESIEVHTQTLVDKIASICEREQQARSSSPNERGNRPGAFLPGSTEIDEAVAKTIKHVCSREPLPGLLHFFKCLQPRLGKLLTRQRLWERAGVRRFVADAFRRQNSSTYEPMRTWLSRPETQWADRFTPEQTEVSHVAVNRPASRKGYVAGVVFLVIGLIGISAGLLTSDRFFVAGGGWLSLAASVLMTLPTGWVRHPRNRVREGQEASASAPLVSYRKRAGGHVFFVATLLILAGLAGLTWPLWPAEWTSITTVWAIVLAVIAGVGVASIVACPSQAHSDQVSRQEAPGHVSPPAWQCRGIGVLCLAVAWVVFCLGLPTPSAPQTATLWIVHLVGLAMVAVGVGWALLPRTGYAYFIDRVPRMPQPLAGGIGRPTANHDLGRQVVAIAGWVNRLTLEPGPWLGQSQAGAMPRDRETLFDFLAPDWEDQLAKAFRLALETRSGKSLTALAHQPVLWAECITKELQDPRASCSDLTALFALQAVKAWIESHTLAELLGMVQIDVERFGRLTARLAAPHWPAPRVEPEMSAGVIAVAKPLWDALSSQTQAVETVPLVSLDWDIRSDAIVVMRVVQGLSEGWRGFPGLPGQTRDAAREAAGR
jgi:hypothetical protein